MGNITDTRLSLLDPNAKPIDDLKQTARSFFHKLYPSSHVENNKMHSPHFAFLQAMNTSDNYFHAQSAINNFAPVHHAWFWYVKNAFCYFLLSDCPRFFCLIKEKQKINVPRETHVITCITRCNVVY